MSKTKLSILLFIVTTILLCVLFNTKHAPAVAAVKAAHAFNPDAPNDTPEQETDGAIVGRVEPRLATLAQQKMCADQARKFVTDPDFDHSSWMGYANHYDPKLNVCYLRVLVNVNPFTDAKYQARATQVFDAFEGVERANLLTDMSGNIEAGACSITLMGQEPIYCHTVDEFYVLVKRYFGIDRYM
jgi:hypothetical protein